MASEKPSGCCEHICTRSRGGGTLEAATRWDLPRPQTARRKQRRHDGKSNGDGFFFHTPLVSTILCLVVGASQPHNGELMQEGEGIQAGCIV